MTRRTRQIYLSAIAILTAIGAAAFVANPGLHRDPAAPTDVPRMATWLTAHPADWMTESALADGALDTSLPHRVQLWHASYDLAIHVAPLRPNPPAAFVRAGLFHWYELGPADRKDVLDVAAPLLREAKFFGRVYAALFDLTHDFAYLRRNAPPSQNALSWLSELAMTNGLFAEYRELREAQRSERWRTFQRERHTDHAAPLVNFLPEHLDAHDEPLVRGILEELDRKPVDAQHIAGRAEDLALFAMRHGLQPLSAFEPFIDRQGALSNPTRARLALALNNADLASKVEITSTMTRTPEWMPYHLERALFEARNGDPAIADAYLARTALLGVDARVLSAAEEIARLAGDTQGAARYRAKLIEESRQPRKWTETCSENELCDHAFARQYVADPENRIRIEASVVQSDQIPPYLELYVDDALVAEGEVHSRRVFEAPAVPGLHRLEVRLVNRYTRNRIQRRVRLS